MKPSSPIKRHPALQPLSREHMSGLIQARNLAAASDSRTDDRRADLARFAVVWDEEIAAHFADEDQLLGPLLSSESLTRLLTEHRRLSKLAEQAISQSTANDPDPALLRQLGILLHDHIRWEEREAFNEAERAATPADLDRLSHHAAAIHRSRPGSRPRLRL